MLVKNVATGTKIRGSHLVSDDFCKKGDHISFPIRSNNSKVFRGYHWR
jgi:hypothetical protein